MYEAGVAFAIKTGLVGKLSGLPKGIDLLMILKLPLSGNQQATIISAYAITMTSQMKSKLSSTIIWIVFSTTPKLQAHHSRWLKGQSWQRLPGLGWIDRISGNWQMQQFWSSAPMKSAQHDLQISNTVFRLPNRNKTSKIHPRSKYWHLIDYAIVWRKDRQHARVTKTMCGAYNQRQIINWLSAYSTSSSILHGNDKARKIQRDWMSPSWREITRDNAP